MSLGTMTAEHPRFAEFKKKLEGPRYCNFHEKEPGNRETVTWDCTSKSDRTHARRLLAEMGASHQDIELSLIYFSENGGYCDCEIIFNVLSQEERDEWLKIMKARHRVRSRRRKNPGRKDAANV